MNLEFILLIIAAGLCEFVDSGLGMMYGTVLSPVLILLGFSPQEVVPSILFSQAIGGMIASIGHNRFKNADLSFKSEDFKAASVIYGLGVIAVFVGAFIGVKISKELLNLYIGLLVTVMGLIVIFRKNFKFSWHKVIFIGIISAFNKALSGGGYGPLVASGLIVSGKSGKSAIGTTDFAEAPICITAFFVWALLKHQFPDSELLIPLTVGSMIGACFGPYALSHFKSNQKLTTLIGWFALVLGLMCIFK
jgi:hypothetical protein